MFKREPQPGPGKTRTVPMMPIRDIVIFPHMMTPFIVGRQTSVRALEAALAADKIIFLSTQHDPLMDDPSIDQIFPVGTLASIVQSVKLPDGNIRVLVEGSERARILEMDNREGFFQGTVEVLTHEDGDSSRVRDAAERVRQLFDNYVKVSQTTNAETVLRSLHEDDAGRLADTIAANLPLSIDDKQELLAMAGVEERLNRLSDLLEFESEKASMDRNIQSRVKRQMEKAQREFYLNEKMKAIQKELGRGEKSDLDELKKAIESAGMPEEVQEKAMQEFKRLEMMPPLSAETTVSRNYIDWLVAVPWKTRSREIRSMKRAEAILEEDHYGLEKIKNRVLEFLAVRRLVRKPRGSVLCLVGPPGVGKTSLGKSIARATGRQFVRVSLGGVRDEAEVRGHRRTYIGALPGQIIQLMKKAGTINPVFMLDEVDKMSSDFRGDPSSALMEVLDPEQNGAFNDHFLDVDYDLSNVMFICTANVTHTIPQPLLDRMEVLRLSGYTDEEKLQIAERYLVTKQLKATGLKEKNLSFTREGLLHIVENYTREAGVRNLEREIANVCRKVARSVVTEGKEVTARLTPDTAKDFLGVTKYRKPERERKNEVGLTQGLAWTEMGGEMLATEATIMDGKGKLTLTGKLGEVMQESGKAAMSYVRSRAANLQLPDNFYRNIDIHVHLPEGAIPKDGPSAGITLCTSIVSALTKIPVRSDTAMTGEITLRGKVLPIGGLKEKLLAAHRAGITEIILPRENQKDLDDIPEAVRKELNLHFVEHVDQVLEIALERPLSSLPKRPEAVKEAPPAYPAKEGDSDQDSVAN